MTCPKAYFHLRPPGPTKNQSHPIWVQSCCRLQVMLTILQAENRRLSSAEMSSAGLPIFLRKIAARAHHRSRPAEPSKNHGPRSADWSSFLVIGVCFFTADRRIAVQGLWDKTVPHKEGGVCSDNGYSTSRQTSSAPEVTRASANWCWERVVTDPALAAGED